jgi:phosphate uptake regulator
MRRKLVKQGPSTLTISLPASWVRNNNLKAGEEVVLNVQNSNIVIEPDRGEEPKSTITLDVRNRSDTFVKTLLSAIYKKGYDEARLLIRKEQFAIIDKGIRDNLLGFEIVQQSNESVTIRFVTKVDSDELPALTRHAFFVTLSIAEAAAQGAQLEEMLVLEETNNRIVNYCERILNKNASQEEDTIFRYIIVWLLEKIADDYRDIYKRKEKVSKEDATLTAQLVRQFYELFYKYSLEKHDTFIKALSAAVQQCKQRNSALLPVLFTLQQTAGSLTALNAKQSAQAHS